MTHQLSDREMVTGDVRLAFPQLWTPVGSKKKPDDLRFSAALLIKPDDTQTVNDIIRVVRAAMMETWGKLVKLPGHKNPIRDAAEKEGELEGYDPGWKFVNVKSGANNPVAVVDQALRPIAENPPGSNRSKELWPGCWVRAYLTAYCWDHEDGGKGVSLSLNSVQKRADGDRLGSAATAADVRDVFQPLEGFDAGETEGDAGLADLFGE